MVRGGMQLQQQVNLAAAQDVCDNRSSFRSFCLDTCLHDSAFEVVLAFSENRIWGRRRRSRATEPGQMANLLHLTSN